MQYCFALILWVISSFFMSCVQISWPRGCGAKLLDIERPSMTSRFGTRFVLLLSSVLFSPLFVVLFTLCAQFVVWSNGSCRNFWMIQKQANYVLAIGILNYFMHHIAPFVEFDRYNICAAGFIYSSEPVNFPLVLYYNVSWSDKFYMYYHWPLQTFHLSDFLKKRHCVQLYVA